MVEQNVFIETVREVSQIIRVSQEPLSKEQILGYFKDMELNEEQKEQIYAYFLTPHPDGEENASAEEASEETTASGEGQAEETTGEPKKTESRVFQMYLEEIKGIRRYEQAELDALYQRLSEGDETAVRQLSDAWLYRVYELACQLAESEADFEDVVQEGNLGLFLALSELCGSGAHDIEQRLTEAVRSSMRACITENAGKEDDENAIIGKVSLVNEAKKYLASQNGREPSAAEIAEYTKLTPEELSGILSML